jgi:hypothetical protein
MRLAFGQRVDCPLSPIVTAIAQSTAVRFRGVGWAGCFFAATRFAHFLGVVLGVEWHGNWFALSRALVAHATTHCTSRRHVDSLKVYKGRKLCFSGGSQAHFVARRMLHGCWSRLWLESGLDHYGIRLGYGKVSLVPVSLDCPRDNGLV